MLTLPIEIWHRMLYDKSLISDVLAVFPLKELTETIAQKSAPSVTDFFQCR